MRIKFLPPHSKQSYTVNYLFKKAEISDNDSPNKCVLLHSNDDNNSKELWIDRTKEFCEIREQKNNYSGKSSKYKIDWNKNTMHLVISVHPKDGPKLENAWTEISHQIHQELKIGQLENNSIAWLHKDKDHHHVHLLFSKMDNEGNKFDDSNIGRRLNDIAKQFDLTYDLSPGANNAPADNVSNRNPYKKEFVKRLYESFKESNTFLEYADHLNSRGIKMEIVNRKDGVSNLVYTDVKTGMKYFESTLSNRYKFENISKLDRSNVKKQFFTYSDQKSFIQNSISKCLNISKNETEFEYNLINKYNIKLIKHSNTSGTFGYSFQQINSNESYSFKASELGYSYKKIQYYLNKEKVDFKQKDKTSESLQINEKSTENNLPTNLLHSPILNVQSEMDDLDKRNKRKKKKKKGL